MIDFSVNIGTLRLNNPVLVASGTFGYGQEFADFMDLNQLGGIITKTVTLEPRPGNPPPRIVESAAGMLNSIGLPNPGVKAFIAEKMQFLRSLKTRIIVNVAGKNGDEFVKVVQILEQIEGIDAFELNYSCPNVREGGLSFSADPRVAEQVTRGVRKATKKPIIAKLTPNITSIAEIGLAVEIGGADAVSAINTLVGMAVDVWTRKPKLATITGGLSGPAIRPIALAKVYELVQKINIPIVAIGGIASAFDALEFMIAGARAIQVGTANFMNPRAALDVVRGIEAFCRERGVHRINDIIGTMVR